MVDWIVGLVRRMRLAAAMGLQATASLVMGAGARLGIGFKNVYFVECFDPAGRLKWSERIENLIVNEGLNEILEKFWKGSSYTAAHFVGLKGTGAIAAANTMAAHAAWSDVVPYSNATRPGLTMGAVASQSVDNTASKAVFNLDATATVAGMFVTTNNTKSGTTGILIGAGDFAAPRAVSNGDTLNVTVTATAASS